MAEQDAPTRTDLSDLVRNRRAELRLSLRAVQDRTIGPNGEPLAKYGWIDRLEKGKAIVPPTLEQLQALAPALELPLGRLKDAAAGQFFGVDSVYSPDEQVRALVHNFEDLSPEDQRKVLAMVEAFRQG